MQGEREGKGVGNNQKNYILCKGLKLMIDLKVAFGQSYLDYTKPPSVGVAIECVYWGVYRAEMMRTSGFQVRKGDLGNDLTALLASPFG